MPVVGTLLHEAGHYVVALVLGCQPQLHYASTQWNVTASAMLSPGGGLAIRLGGPSVDIVVGMVGLVWLARLRRGTEPNAPLGYAGWIAALMALFWSRPVFNTLRILAALATQGTAGGYDELAIARQLGMPSGALLGVTAPVGAGVCLAVVLQFVPSRCAASFTLGGVLGCGVGYGLWYGWLGPILLP